MDRIEALERKIAEAQAELQALKSGQPPKPAAPPEKPRGTVVRELLTERSDGPSLQEARKLFQIVRPFAPHPLADKYDEDRPFRSFCAAFRWISNVGRQDMPDSRRALTYWLDSCRNWLRQRNAIGSEIDVNAIITATLASGDIPYQRADPSQGRLWEIGLVLYGGRPASADSWRQVLSSGTIRLSVHSVRAQVEHAPVRMLGF
jgi:hypothetical protein